MFLWYVRDGWRDIYSERGFLLPISSSRSQGVPTLAPPCKLIRDACDRLHIPCSTLILSTLSKSDCVVLLIWSPSSYTPIVPECPDCAVIYLFTYHNVTACQSTQGHKERTENPWHMLYNTNNHQSFSPSNIDQMLRDSFLFLNFSQFRTTLSAGLRIHLLYPLAKVYCIW